MNGPATQRTPGPRHGLLCGLLLSAVVLAGHGCHSTGYLAERRRDLADVATATVGVGLGAKARLGPVHLSPLILCMDAAGLRGGEWFRTPVLDQEVANPPQEVGALWWNSSVWDLPPGCPDRERMRQRGKAHLAAPLHLPPKAGLYDILSDTPPFISMPRLDWPAEKLKVPRYPAAYHSQVELNLALGASLRLGLNPGEFVDFVLGWMLVDIYRDDDWSIPPAPPPGTSALPPWPWRWSAQRPWEWSLAWPWWERP